MDGRPWDDRPAPPIAESWEEVAVRLRRELDDLTGMLEQLQSRPPARKRRHRERLLKRWLGAVVPWLEALVGRRGPPRWPDEAKEVALELVGFDLERPRAVDLFHDLLEEAGEPFGLG